MPRATAPFLAVILHVVKSTTPKIESFPLQEGQGSLLRCLAYMAASCNPEIPPVPFHFHVQCHQKEKCFRLLLPVFPWFCHLLFLIPAWSMPGVLFAQIDGVGNRWRKGDKVKTKYSCHVSWLNDGYIGAFSLQPANIRSMTNMKIRFSLQNGMQNEWVHLYLTWCLKNSKPFIIRY